MTIPGPPASVLAAILRASPDFPYNPADPSQRRMAWFSPYNSPALPSLITDGVSLPQNAYLDANITISGYAASQGWGTQGVTVVSAAYTPSPADAVILCNANGGAFTITLPDATQPGFISPGQRYTVKKTDTSANTVTLAASAGQTIDGAPTQAITPAQSAISVVFSGTGWEVTDGGSAIGTNAISGVVVSGTPATGDVLTATGAGTADWQPSATGVLTTLGDTLYEGSTGPARLAGNTTTTKNFYIQTGTGSASAAPAWGGIATADLPAGSAGQTLTTTSAGAVAWQRAPVDWINAVTAYGADPTGAADSTTAIQDAVNAAATANTVAYLPAGTYLTSSAITNSTGKGSLMGAGRWGTIINFTGTGDCIRWYNSTYGGSQPGGDGSGVRSLRIDGTSSGAGSTGLHTGDQTAMWHDVVVTNFSGAGSIGVHLDNTIWWTEEMRGHFWAYNCASGVVFDVSGATTSTNSFGYNDIDIYVNCAANQNGVVLQNGAYVYHNTRFRMRGNFTGSASAVTNSALTITGTVPTGHPAAGSASRLFGSGIDIAVEVTGTFAFTPTTVTFGSGSNQLTGSGTIRFAGFTNSATVLGSSAQVIYFDGFFQGDANLDAADTPLGPVEYPVFGAISTGFPAGWSGHIRYRRLGNMRVQIDWALTVASGTVLSPGTVIAAMPAGYYYPSDTKTVCGDLSASGHFYCPLSISSAGHVSYQGPSQTLATTGYVYGQAEYNIAL